MIVIKIAYATTLLVHVNTKRSTPASPPYSSQNYVVVTLYSFYNQTIPPIARMIVVLIETIIKLSGNMFQIVMNGKDGTYNTMKIAFRIDLKGSHTNNDRGKKFQMISTDG